VSSSHRAARQALIRDTVEFACHHDVYGLAGETRRLVLDDLEAALHTRLPRSDRLIDQIDSDIRALERLARSSDRPLLAEWLDVIGSRLRREGRSDACSTCDALGARWQALAPPAEPAIGAATARSQTRRVAYGVGATALMGIVAVALLMSRDEPARAEAPCAWADPDLDPRAAHVVSSGFITDTHGINQRLRAFSIGGRRVEGATLDMIKIEPLAEGEPTRVRILTAVDAELTDVVLEATRGTVTARWSGKEHTQGDAIQLRLDGTDAVRFQLVGADPRSMELIVDGGCRPAPPWPTLSATAGRISMADRPPRLR